MNLEPPQVSVPPAWSRDTYPRYVYPGECYERAFAHVLDHDIEDMLLVHGVATHRHEKHAWVELPGNVMFDGVAQRFFAKYAYAIVMQVRPVTVYPPDAAVDLLLRTQRYGLWRAALRDNAERPLRPAVLVHAS